MEQQGRTISLHYCDVAERAKPFVDVLIERLRVYPAGMPEGITYRSGEPGS
jgi:hypothetical protein